MSSALRLFLMRLAGASLLVTLALAPTVLGNCETGAYAIHTVAERVSLDDARTWLFRAENKAVDDGVELELAPVASETEVVLERLHRLLASADAGGFAVELVEGPCRPTGARLVRSPERMDGLTLRLGGCSLPAEGDAVAIYDRDARRLRFPAALEVVRSPAELADVEDALPGLALDQDLRLVPGGPAIRAGDVEAVSVAQTRVGDGFAVAVVVLRLRHLERLLDAGEGAELLAGYLERARVRDLLGDFPVIFFRRPGEAPAYVGDGSWCGGYRFASELERADGTTVAAFDRFAVARAWDADGDGLPDLLELAGGDEGPNRVLYALDPGPSSRLRVVDEPMGC